MCLQTLSWDKNTRDIRNSGRWRVHNSILKTITCLMKLNFISEIWDYKSITILTNIRCELIVWKYKKN